MLVAILERLLITMVFRKSISCCGNIPVKNTKLGTTSKQNHSQPRKAMFLQKMILKTTIEKLQMLCIV